MRLVDRHRRLLWTLHREGQLSRSQLHRRMGVRPNTVGELVDELERAGLVRPCPARSAGPGRPRTPLELDPQRRHVLGLALAPGRVQAARVSLRGHRLGPPAEVRTSAPQHLIAQAADLLNTQLQRDTLAVALSAPGFVDPHAAELLFSAALPNMGAASLDPIVDAAGRAPLTLDSEVHALATRWALTHRVPAEQDVLLVSFDDGEVGASLLVGGRPNPGCVRAANELGHARFPVDTEPCYCGRRGCLERIFSTAHLRQLTSDRRADLTAAARAWPDTPHAQAGGTLLDLLALGIANAINLLRPHRLVLASRFVRHRRWIDALTRRTRAELLPALADRVHLELWDEDATGTGETAAWLALAVVLGQRDPLRAVREGESATTEPG